MDPLGQFLNENLVCPACGERLSEVNGQSLKCLNGHEYRQVAGIPCLLNSQLGETHSGYAKVLSENAMQSGEMSPAELANYVRDMIVPVAGNLFHGASLESRLPIPRFPLTPCGDTVLLDIGCNWGRWSIAAAKLGFKVIGVDLHLRGLLAAQQLAKQLVPENMPRFVQADARSLPFSKGCFDSIFSYSVLQHFSKSDADLILAECGRILKPSGNLKIQMPNKMGLRSLYVLGKRGFSDGSEFDVRYYGLRELREKFSRHIGPTRISVDCFLGLNVHKEDLDLIQWYRRPIIWVAETAKAMTKVVPPLANFADSVYAESVKSSS